MNKKKKQNWQIRFVQVKTKPTKSQLRSFLSLNYAKRDIKSTIQITSSVFSFTSTNPFAPLTKYHYISHFPFGSRATENFSLIFK